MRAKYNGSTLNSGVDPQDLIDFTIGAEHMIDGALKFKSWGGKVMADLGELVHKITRASDMTPDACTRGAFVRRAGRRAWRLNGGRRGEIHRAFHLVENKTIAGIRHTVFPVRSRRCDLVIKRGRAQVFESKWVTEFSQILVALRYFFIVQAEKWRRLRRSWALLPFHARKGGASDHKNPRNSLRIVEGERGCT